MWVMMVKCKWTIINLKPMASLIMVNTSRLRTSNDGSQLVNINNQMDGIRHFRLKCCNSTNVDTPSGMWEGNIQHNGDPERCWKI